MCFFSYLFRSKKVHPVKYPTFCSKKELNGIKHIKVNFS